MGSTVIPQNKTHTKNLISDLNDIQHLSMRATSKGCAFGRDLNFTSDDAFRLSTSNPFHKVAAAIIYYWMSWVFGITHKWTHTHVTLMPCDVQRFVRFFVRVMRHYYNVH